MSNMDFKGCYSFKNIKSSIITLNDTDDKLKIEHVNQDVAVIYFINATNIRISPPAGYRLNNITSSEDVVARKDEFTITWISNYEMYNPDGIVVLKLYNQKQSAIDCENNVEVV